MLTEKEANILKALIEDEIEIVIGAEGSDSSNVIEKYLMTLTDIMAKISIYIDDMQETMSNVSMFAR